MKMNLGPYFGPGPLGATYRLTVITIAGQRTFDPHAHWIDDGGNLLLFRGFNNDDSSVRLSALAAFPAGGWQGIYYDEEPPGDALTATGRLPVGFRSDRQTVTSPIDAAPRGSQTTGTRPGARARLSVILDSVVNRRSQHNRFVTGYGRVRQLLRCCRKMR